ncbi:Alanine--tRNA ligase [Labeo rohita]|uniref:Alanine--tRNA ligase n=1 Tax=Labeo rohita TaxID=84645 RepID=A0ABQ8M9C5_LABRO|nr:Alanine--tRNA ligase [Labeo rohita]
MQEEHLIGLLDLRQIDAEYISSQILNHLSAAGYSADNIVSQYYDGTSVMSKFLVQVLGVLKPATAILQSQTVDVCKAGEVVSATLESLKAIRRDEYQTCGDVVHPSKRRTLNKLDDSVVLSTVGHTDCENPTIPPRQSLKRSLLSILDRAIFEMENRFFTKNVDLMKAVSCLVPTSSGFLDATLLSPLHLLAGTADSVSLENEIFVPKPILAKEFPDETDLSTLCKHLQMYKEAFPELNKLYVTALVIGVSSASCESSFSTLSWVLTPFRCCMSCRCMAHEKSITSSLNMDEFVRMFARKNRRLML